MEFSLLIVSKTDGLIIPISFINLNRNNLFSGVPQSSSFHQYLRFSPIADNKIGQNMIRIVSPLKNLYLASGFDKMIPVEFILTTVSGGGSDGKIHFDPERQSQGEREQFRPGGPAGKGSFRIWCSSRQCILAWYGYPPLRRL
jgi:hypothetical protein